MTLSSEESRQQLMNSVRKRPENKICADCGAKNPTGAVLNLGIFICTTCTPFHSSFGHRVVSVLMHNFTPRETHFFDTMGNEKSNMVFLLHYPFERLKTPSRNQILYAKDHDFRQFLTHKYVEKAWVERPVGYQQQTKPRSDYKMGQTIYGYKDAAESKDDDKDVDSYPGSSRLHGDRHRIGRSNVSSAPKSSTKSHFEENWASNSVNSDISPVVEYDESSDVFGYCRQMTKDLTQNLGETLEYHLGSNLGLSGEDPHSYSSVSQDHVAFGFDQKPPYHGNFSNTSSFTSVDREEVIDFADFQQGPSQELSNRSIPQSSQNQIGLGVTSSSVKSRSQRRLVKMEATRPAADESYFLRDVSGTQSRTQLPQSRDTTATRDVLSLGMTGASTQRGSKELPNTKRDDLLNFDPFSDLLGSCLKDVEMTRDLDTSLGINSSDLAPMRYDPYLERDTPGRSSKKAHSTTFTMVRKSESDKLSQQDLFRSGSKSDEREMYSSDYDFFGETQMKAGKRQQPFGRFPETSLYDSLEY